MMHNANPKKPKPANMFGECFGLFCVFVWFFCSMYTFEGTLHNGYFYIPAFLIVLFCSILGFGLYCKRDIDKLSRFAMIFAPFGILCTAIMYLLPPQAFLSLYIVSGAFMGPLLLRRIYGAVETGGEKRRFRCYFQAIAFTIVFHSVWVFIPVDYAVKLPIVALLAFFGWFGVWRLVPEPAYVELPKLSRTSAIKQTLLVIGVFALWYVVNFLFSLIHTYFIYVGFEGDFMLYFGGTLLPAIGFFSFAYFFDKGQERAAFLFGMAFALLGTILSLTPGNSFLIFPLLITDGLGGTFTEFILIASSVYLYRSSRHPFWDLSCGFAIFILSSAVGWLGDILFGWALPAGPSVDARTVLYYIGPAAMATVLFMVAGLYLIDKHREKNLVLALLRYFSSEPSMNTATVPVRSERTDAHIQEASFNQREKEIALLLIEGETQRNIARKFHLTSAEMSQQIDSIRKKVSSDGGSNPIIDEIAKKYKLTRREREMLICLQHGMTNAEIASDFFLSEETVKTHVRNLMKKLPVENRQDVGAWIESLSFQK